MQRQENRVENKKVFNNESRMPKSEKIFDKKKYRLKKYSNKYKVHKWQLRKTVAILRDFYNKNHRGEHGQQNKLEFKKGTSGPKKSPSFFDFARSQYLEKKADKKRKKEEILRILTIKKEALRKYKENKMQKYKKLSKKTKKGQPVMKERIELLLQKIQQDKNNDVTV
ncbi:PREDICTED: rRNA-processing protein FYV7 isoform X2 [Polistes dominula]|nr:PREDICTED: rRNA-processing protein FYV7 isoform X2 [Polistes dominula]XP_015186662.1 PREDICTED: rRNA-processing protein FYV7 isoform X2 [Polistes dominula]